MAEAAWIDVLGRRLNGAKRTALGTGTGLAIYRALWKAKPQFLCPICGYCGPFADLSLPQGCRRHAQCPKCWTGARHRLHRLMMDQLSQRHDFSKLELLHVAPDRVFRERFQGQFRRQVTADLNMKDVDYNLDLTSLPFPDASYDVVFASHVLEHIQDDRLAIAEVRRVLRPGGFAILPVPIHSPQTVEYETPNPFDDFHVRAPGPDYFERYRGVFSSVELYRSEDFEEKHQLHLYEDRTHFPTERLPLRRPMAGERHGDIVPVCYV